MNRGQLDGLSWRMSEVYSACVDRLLVNLARHFKFISEGAPIPGGWDYQIRKLAEMGQVTRESEEIILSMLGDADGALQAMLEESIRNGLKDAEPALRKATERGLMTGNVQAIAPRQMQAFQAYYAQSADKLNLVNTVMLESTENAYRATVSDIATKIETTQGILNTSTGQIVTGTDTFNRVQRDAVRRMVDNGLTGFIDHGGHHWSPEAYVAMDMRTTMTNTARAAVSERMDDYGCELYQVSWHDGARPLCYPWQGKVISTNGWTGEVEDGDGNKVQVHSESEIESFRYGGGLFGVNCGHYPIPFFPGFSKQRPPEQNEEENAKEYAESQQQRALERKVREEKRELEVMKAQGATKEEIDAQRIRVKNANTELNDFCKQTGRARQPGRTSTPINATFPDGYKQTKWEQGIRRRDPTKSTPAPPNVASQATQETPPVVEYQPGVRNVKDFAEYKKYMVDNYGIDVTSGVNKLDFGLVKEATAGFETVAHDYPEVAKGIKKIRLSKSGIMSCNGAEITFNSDYFTNPDYLNRAIEGCVKRGWWPVNTSAASIGSHETAHGLEMVLIEKSGKYTTPTSKAFAWNGCYEARDIVKEACDEILLTSEGKGKTAYELIKEGISGYGSKGGNSETMAEAFADVFANGENATTLAKAIVEATKRKYRSYIGGV